MPSSDEILDGLTYIANSWSGIAVAWHIAVGCLLAALIVGWRPRRRQLSLILTLPLVSVALFAWLTHNPFNGTLFALGAVALGIIGARLSDIPMQRASNPAALIGLATIAFGWVYPHFLEDGSAVRYLYAVPTGLIPCPTLSVVVGFALLASGLGSRAWSLTLAARSSTGCLEPFDLAYISTSVWSSVRRRWLLWVFRRGTWKRQALSARRAHRHRGSDRG
jgi:hypothetical protein